MCADTETARLAIASYSKDFGHSSSVDKRQQSYTVNGRTFGLGEIVRHSAAADTDALLIVVGFCHFREACFVKPTDGGRYVGPGTTKIACDDLINL